MYQSEELLPESLGPHELLFDGPVGQAIGAGIGQRGHHAPGRSGGCRLDRTQHLRVDRSRYEMLGQGERRVGEPIGARASEQAGQRFRVKKPVRRVIAEDHDQLDQPHELDLVDAPRRVDGQVGHEQGLAKDRGGKFVEGIGGYLFATRCTEGRAEVAEVGPVERGTQVDGPWAVGMSEVQRAHHLSRAGRRPFGAKGPNRAMGFDQATGTEGLSRQLQLLRLHQHVDVRAGAGPGVGEVRICSVRALEQHGRHRPFAERAQHCVGGRTQLVCPRAPVCQVRGEDGAQWRGRLDQSALDPPA